jgi:hypothetical protein
MAESYRVELSGFGVESVLVEPGGYPTGFVHNLVKPSDASRDAGYGAMAQAPQAALDAFEAALKANPAQDPRRVAEAIVGLIAKPPANDRYAPRSISSAWPNMSRPTTTSLSTSCKASMVRSA